MGVNPVGQLEPGDKPRRRGEPVRILEGADLGKLLEHAGASPAMFEFLAYPRLRIGEALGLRWCDVDFEAAVPASASSFPDTSPMCARHFGALAPFVPATLAVDRNQSVLPVALVAPVAPVLSGPAATLV
jgi:hypothetical protein